MQELTNRLNAFNIRSPDQQYWRHDSAGDSELILKVVMAGAFYPNYFATGLTDEKDAIKDIRELDPKNTVMVQGLPPGKGPLYSVALQTALKDCGKQKSLCFDGSRAFLQFCQETDDGLRTGRINPSVYLACKMNEMRRRFQVVQSHAETGESARMLQKPFLIDVIRPDKFRTELPRPGDPLWMSIVVTSVVSVDHFWACKADQAHFDVQQDLFRGVQEAAKTAPCVPDTIDVGSIVLAPFQDGSGVWFYRAIVQRCVGGRAKLFFVDYGNSGADVPVKKLKKIPQNLAAVPFQAVEFELCNVRRLAAVGKKTLEELLMSCENRCNAKIYSVVSNRVRVNLFTFDDRIVNDILVERGCVEKCEEGVLSERSHREWNYDGDVVSSARDSGTLDWHPIPVEARGHLIPHPQRSRPVSLFGPGNPLKIALRSMINIGMLRSVSVGRDSVNSVLLNQDPTDEHRTLLVAASVGVNESGTTMIARNTTLLPNIHGLPFIVAMIFTPVLEMRTNAAHTRLTGALCGLGSVKTRLGMYAILPEHDMELDFDVEVTNEDLVQINALRMKINMCVGTEEEVATWSQTAIHSIQKSARKKLLEIVTRRRASMQPETVRRPFQWDQLQPCFVNEHSIDHRSADKKDLYRLHDGVLLNT